MHTQLTSPPLTSPPLTRPSHRASTRNCARSTLLMTGFGPFPSVPVNATMTLLPRLAAAAHQLFPGVRIITDILPTEWVAAPQRIDRLIAEHHPDILLHFGVSSRARGFEIERRGRNLCVMAPDAGGARPASPEVCAGGQLLLPSRLPVAEIVRRVRRLRVPAYQSWNAGTYLCNATLYHVLSAISDPAIQSGFVHIPASLAPAGRQSTHGHALRVGAGCPLTWTQALVGGLEIIAALLDQPTPHPVRRRLALQLQA